ncbi:hypothetical protein DWW76_13530 [Coprobacillus sp. AF17-11AC]|nr:hypothetical protein DWW80_12900 [Coprobacillus sp. AF17-17AC]RGG83007.1 hypothetical protein DWW76_13530 [Coprobacillus sp. AF17-11AC]
MNFKDELKEQFKDFSDEIRQSILDKKNGELNEAHDQGFQVCLFKTLDLLVDSKLKEEDIVSLLQKHFDLRRSEVENLIRTAKNRKSRDKR